MSPQLEVSQGLLEGKECKTFYGKKYYSFEGIPYAKPPVGRLRFRNPELPENWTGVRDATKPGNKCCQVNPYDGTAIGSEDCLYLNVYTPVLPHDKKQKLPVIFFVHGGRLTIGYGNYYSPDYMIKHDVILVTCNYRLNVLGFLCLNIAEAPGNSGLKDTVFALRWIKENIDRFNGDPNNVTAMGESAGAGLVTSYMTSKMADGLLHKVIAQSGNGMSDLYMVDEDPIAKAKAVASYLGKEDLDDERSLYDFLVDAPVDDLVVACSMAEINRHPGILNALFLPVVEKKFDKVELFFDQYARIDFLNNRFKKIPLLTGFNSREGASFVQTDDGGKIIFQTDLFYYIPRYLYIKKDTEGAVRFEKKMSEFYFNDKEINETLKEEYVKLMSDAHFHKDLMIMPEVLSKFYNDIYFYKFNYSGNLNTRVMKSLGLQGAAHGDMIQYQFYRKNKHSKCAEKDLKIVEFLSEAWCNFAKFGKPTWRDQETEWLPYTHNERNALVIDEELKMERNVDGETMKFWLDAVQDKAKL